MFFYLSSKVAKGLKSEQKRIFQFLDLTSILRNSINFRKKDMLNKEKKKVEMETDEHP